MDEKTLTIVEPTYSVKQHSHEAWDPEWIVQRFIFMLRCNLAKCGEAVTVSGETQLDEVIDEGEHWAIEQRLYPRSMYPGPPIIVIPNESPEPVRDEIELSFQLFWSDKGACSTRLRTSVELLMDDFKIPRDGKTAKGKTYRLSLQDRVGAFETIDKVHGKTFDALRMVGNVGTHEGGLSREALLDAYEIYEDALSELYGKHKAKIDTLRKKIIAKKGKY